MYPNPFNTSLTIDNQAGKVVAYTLMDLQGRILKAETNLKAGLVQINELDELAHGTYVILLTGKNQERGSIKVMK